MLNGKWRGQELGSGTGVWSMSEQVRAGTLKLKPTSSRPRAACTAATATA
jgi:hypothetical protein